MSLTDADKNWMGEVFQQHEAGITERLQQLETRLTEQFRASPAEARQQTHAAVLTAIAFETGLPE